VCAAASEQRLVLFSLCLLDSTAASPHHCHLDGICVRLRLTAAVVVVFGATGGIGSALARRLHGLGSSGSGQAPSAIVISADGGDKLKSLQQQLQGVDAIPADALEPASVSI
jgi:FlaA1/EpsC-like NDP-sugar epimerase